MQREYKNTSLGKRNCNLQKIGMQARDKALQNVNPSETTSPTFSYATNAPSNPFSLFPALSPTSVTLQQDCIPAALTTDALSQSPVPSSHRCYSSGLVSSSESMPLQESILLQGAIPSSESVPLPRSSPALSSTSQSNSQVRPIRNKVREGLRNCTLQFLEEKLSKEMELKKQKLHLEQEKLQFEKQKI